jgi:Domain of unknown function (DUF4331)
MRMRTALTVLGAASVLTMMSTGDSQASSHREAPFITKNPKVDGTDFYMFQSYGDGHLAVDNTSTFTTLIANYIPLQDAYGGPNYFTFDPDALYEIEIENSGDSAEDLTFQFQFSNALNAASAKGITLNVGGKTNSIPTVQANIDQKDNPGHIINAGNEAALLNVQESYTINLVKGNRRTGTVTPVANAVGGATTFVKPVDYIGSSTLGNAAAYATYAGQHVYGINIPGCATPGKVFVGQRAEGFRVNLGVIFDLVNVSAFGGLATITNPAARNALNFNPAAASFAASNYQYDNTATKNVSSIELEVPTKCLTSDGLDPATTVRPVLGGWTTASVRQARVINPLATYGKPSKEGGAWAQVSRLGMPLTNEVVIGIADKDRFNSSEPKDDAQFIDYVTNPTLPQVLQAIFGGASAPTFPAGTVVRNDLVAIFLKGVTGVNVTGSVGEMLRLNTKLPTKPTGGQVDLGAAACFNYTANCLPAGSTIDTCFTVAGGASCDTGGFPNGRRPGDDVVDIELSVLLGYFVPRSDAPAGGTILHDAVLNTETQFDPNFPYLKNPHSGDQ